MLQLPADNCEPLRFVRYGRGEYFARHHDAAGQRLAPHTPGGPRVWTLYLFLGKPTPKPNPEAVPGSLTRKPNPNTNTKPNPKPNRNPSLAAAASGGAFAFPHLNLTVPAVAGRAR